MGRKCSHCGNNGHNSRTCGGGGGGGRGPAGNAGVLWLFGVHLRVAAAASPMKKSFSVDCLASGAAAVSPISAPSSSSPSTPTSSSSSSSSSNSLVSVEEAADKAAAAPDGYLSDGLLGRRTQERKKGVAWSEEEHRAFLAGLEKLGKGDWRGISRNFVTTRTPTQVASHAQKHFLRQNSLHKNRRSSLFDVVGSCELTVQLAADPSASSEQNARVEHRRHLQIDLNTDQQETQLPPCLSLMPCCPGVLHADADATPQPRNSVKPQAPRGLSELELTISSPAMDRSKPAAGGGFFAKGVTVT